MTAPDEKGGLPLTLSYGVPSGDGLAGVGQSWGVACGVGLTGDGATSAWQDGDGGHMAVVKALVMASVDTAGSASMGPGWAAGGVGLTSAGQGGGGGGCNMSGDWNGMAGPPGCG